MFKHILGPVDGSNTSMLAVSKAAGLAKTFGSAVTAVYDFGAGDLLELKGPGKRPVLIPFSEAAVLEIDLEGGRLLVDPIAAGLKDDGEEKPYGNAGGKPRPNNGR